MVIKQSIENALRNYDCIVMTVTVKDWNRYKIINCFNMHISLEYLLKTVNRKIFPLLFCAQIGINHFLPFLSCQNVQFYSKITTCPSFYREVDCRKPLI